MGKLSERSDIMSETHCYSICKIFHIGKLEKKFASQMKKTNGGYEDYSYRKLAKDLGKSKSEIGRLINAKNERQNLIPTSGRTPSTMLLSESRGLDDGIPVLQGWYTIVRSRSGIPCGSMAPSSIPELFENPVVFSGSDSETLG